MASAARPAPTCTAVPVPQLTPQANRCRPVGQSDKPGLLLPHSRLTEKAPDHAPHRGGAAGPSYLVVASRGTRLPVCAALALPPARQADDPARSIVSVA